MMSGVGHKPPMPKSPRCRNQEKLTCVLFKAKFFCIQVDTTTDCGNIEDELYMVVYFDPHTQDGAVQVRDRFLIVRRPSHCDAKGLYECFERALTYVGVTDWQTKLIDFGCDRTNVNIREGGLRSILEESVPWVAVFWCLAHRLKLALKDALKGTLFTTIDEMLLRLYY